MIYDGGKHNIFQHFHDRPFSGSIFIIMGFSVPVPSAFLGYTYSNLFLDSPLFYSTRQQILDGVLLVSSTIVFIALWFFFSRGMKAIWLQIGSVAFFEIIFLACGVLGGKPATSIAAFSLPGGVGLILGLITKVRYWRSSNN
jgi:hypothetical protein